VGAPPPAPAPQLPLERGGADPNGVGTGSSILRESSKDAVKRVELGMSGHSKWAQIKRQKAANDAKRGQAYTKAGREITVAVQLGGPDPAGNFRLEQALARARGINMPKDTIERAIQRALGGGDSGPLEELTYEGYGPGGVGLLIEVVADNRNRTAAEIRSALQRLGGTLAASGSVAWQFESRGELVVDVGSKAADAIELLAIDLGASDVDQTGDTVTVYTPPAELDRIRRGLVAAGCDVSSAELTMVPRSTTPAAAGDAERVLRMIERLEELDDVRRVHTTVEISDELLAKLAS